VVGWGDDLECGGNQQRDAALNFSPLGREGEIQSAVTARFTGALQKKAVNEPSKMTAESSPGRNMKLMASAAKVQNVTAWQRPR